MDWWFRMCNIKLQSVQKPSLKSYEGPLSRMLVRTSESGLKVQSLVFKKCVPFTQPLSFSVSAVIQRVPYLLGCRQWTHGTTYHGGGFENFGNPISHKDRQLAGRVQPLQYSSVIGPHV